MIEEAVEVERRPKAEAVLSGGCPKRSLAVCKRLLNNEA